MDYNTQRSSMRMPEYGRDIHTMIQHCMQIEPRPRRQACAEAIVKVMARLHPEMKQQADYKQKLWDHLAIMSNFQLDIDYPYTVTTAEKLAQRPAPMPIVRNHIPVKHYGNGVFQILNRLKTMEPGGERDELTRIVANKMKRDLVMYGTAQPDNDRIISDIAHFTDGVIQIDPTTFKFDYININSKSADKGDKGKKKRRK